MDVCPQHEKLIEVVHNIDKVTTALSVRINGSINDIEHHMEVGAAWRIAIVGVIISIVLQIITFSYLWGSASKQISINTERLNILENTERERYKKGIQGIQGISGTQGIQGIQGDKGEKGDK